MNDELREALAEEQGYTICPIMGGYTACDQNCEECRHHKEFVESVNSIGAEQTIT